MLTMLIGVFIFAGIALKELIRKRNEPVSPISKQVVTDESVEYADCMIVSLNKQTD